MNKSIVIYQSTYGTVKHFAEQIAKELGADLAERKKVKIFELTGYDTVIYGGGIYAGRIAGSKLIRRMYRKFPNKHYVVFSVGFTPHTRPDVLKAVRRNSFKDINTEKIDFFHFRSGVDYKKLNIVHRTLLFGKRVSLMIKPKNKLTVENKIFLNRYGKSVALTLDSTLPLTTALKTY